jgi:hypothetical protein
MGFLPPDGPQVIDILGHRRYVTEKWGEIGPLQWRFLLGHGLEPQHYLLDIACGCLQLGLHAIPYLDSGHYIGIEKEQKLIDAGINQELGRDVYEARKPVLICNDQFDFSGIGVRPDFAWSHSLFTHLTPASSVRCLSNLRGVIADHGVYYTTLRDATAYRRVEQRPPRQCFLGRRLPAIVDGAVRPRRRMGDGVHRRLGPSQRPDHGRLPPLVITFWIRVRDG